MSWQVAVAKVQVSAVGVPFLTTVQVSDVRPAVPAEQVRLVSVPGLLMTCPPCWTVVAHVVELMAPSPYRNSVDEDIAVPVQVP